MYSGTLTRAYGARLATLLGTASFLTMGNAIDAHAQGEVAQADEIPETVLITGSLIRGTKGISDLLLDSHGPFTPQARFVGAHKE